MEVFYAAFKVLSSFTIDILYNTSIINDLFEFDTEKNLNLIRNKYKLKLKDNNIVVDNKPDIIPVIDESKNKNPINISNNISKDNEKICINKIPIISKRKLKENNLLSKDSNLNCAPKSKNLEQCLKAPSLVDASLSFPSNLFPSRKRYPCSRLGLAMIRFLFSFKARYRTGI